MADTLLSVKLGEYNEYASLFSKQINNPAMWQEQTGCEMDEYYGYIECCETRLYPFGTWYEHTTGEEYPEAKEWKEYRDYKVPLLSFQA
jgi:hypothetical protein